MKKSNKLLVMAISFPYLFTTYVFGNCILPKWVPSFSGIPIDISIFLLLAVVWFIIALIQVIIKGICVLKDDDYTAHDLLKLNRNFKLIQTPAYICNFILGIILVVTVILVVYVPIIIILDLLSIVLTGVWGMFCMLKLKKEQGISTGNTILYSVLQFIFCMDIVSAIVLPIVYKQERHV